MIAIVPLAILCLTIFCLYDLITMPGDPGCSKLLWFLFILFVPVIGGLLWLLLRYGARPPAPPPAGPVT